MKFQFQLTTKLNKEVTDVNGIIEYYIFYTLPPLFHFSSQDWTPHSAQNALQGMNDLSSTSWKHMFTFRSHCK